MAPLSPRAAPRHRRLPAWCVCVTHRRRLDYAQMRISHHTSTFGYQLELQRLESVSPAARTSPARGPRERVRTCAVICFLSRDGVLWPPSNTIPAAQKSSPSIESVGTERVPYRVLRAVVPLALPARPRLDATDFVRTRIMVFEQWHQCTSAPVNAPAVASSPNRVHEGRPVRHAILPVGRFVTFL
jgi:hypothetical protein